MLYSIETITFSLNALADVQVRIQTNDGGIEFHYVALTRSVTATAPGNATDGAELVPPGIIFRPDGSTPNAKIQSSVANAAGRTLTQASWGYIWALEAARAPGGPIRV